MVTEYRPPNMIKTKIEITVSLILSFIHETIKSVLFNRSGTLVEIISKIIPCPIQDRRLEFNNMYLENYNVLYQEIPPCLLQKMD